MTALSLTVTFRPMDCVSCGVRYLVDEDYAARRSSDARDFFCPNGHATYYRVGGVDRRREYSEAGSLIRLSGERDRLKKRLSVAQGELHDLGERMHRLMHEQPAQPASATTPADHAECLAEQERLNGFVAELQELLRSFQEGAGQLESEKQAAEARLAEAVAASDAARAALKAVHDEVAEMHTKVEELVKERDTHLLRAIQWEYSAELHLAKIAEMKKRNAALKDVKFEVVAEPPEIPKGDPPVHPMLAMCECGHSQRRHTDNADMCQAAECACTGFVLTDAAAT